MFQKIVISFQLLLIGASSAIAQMAPAPFETEERLGERGDLSFFRWDGNFEIGGTIKNLSTSGEPIPEELARGAEGFAQVEEVGKEAAPWLSVQFSAFDLGQRSFIRLRSLEDPQQVQWFNQQTLEQWEGKSAAFNGGFVEITLFAAPNETFSEYIIGSIDFGLEPDEESVNNEQDAGINQEAICGEDHRSASSDNRLGRIMPVGCTGWTINGGLFLTAGHCADDDRMDYLQFEVPKSSKSGTPRHPRVGLQYKIIRSSIVYKDEGIGRDWAIFRVAGSLGTKSPQDKYGYFKIEQTKAKRELVVRGYGLDDDPAGRPPLLRNEDSQTQQQHFGKLGSTSVLSKTRASVKHGVDTRGGNSGGPIVYAEKEDTAIAIHTHGDCTKGGKNSNSGTSFLNQELWSAILTAKDNH